MTGMTDLLAQEVLAYTTGKAAMPALPTSGSIWVALFTAVGTDAGTGFTEVTGGSYARVQTVAANWNAASGSDPSLISNSAAIAFPTATANWGTVIAFGIYDASTAGNLLYWDYLGNFAWQPCTISSGTPGVFTAHANGFSNGDQVVFNTEYGGTAPTGGALTGLLTVAGATTDTFNVGVNTTSTGNGNVRKVTSQSVPSGVTASFAGGSPGALVLTAT